MSTSPAGTEPALLQVRLHSTTVSVPMGSFGGRAVVDVRINGKEPFRLHVDTGARLPTVPNETLAAELGRLWWGAETSAR